jgi:hypothetical protein
MLFFTRRLLRTWTTTEVRPAPGVIDIFTTVNYDRIGYYMREQFERGTGVNGEAKYC